MIQRIARVFFRLVLVCVAAAPDPANCADYVHTSRVASLSIRSEEGVIAVGDVGIGATFCGSTSEMICFQAKDFKFAIPSMAIARTKWTHDGERYEARRIADPLFGRAGPYWLVRQKTGNSFTFVFSDQFGLVVIQAGSRSSGVYLLMQPCGFGSPPDCHSSMREDASQR